MGHEWIIDVIADLQRFASTHDLKLLEQQLHCAATVASSEISQIVDHTCPVNQGDGSETRQFSAIVGASGRA